MSEAKRLHPVTVLFNMIKTLKEWIFGAIGIVALALKDGEFVVLGIASGLMFLLILFVSFLKWLRYTYAVEADELRIEHGIFIRKKRYISKNRIQAIDLTQSVIHRMTGLVRVEIETAGSGSDTEASLKAVAYEEGIRVREQLKYGAGHEIESGAVESEEARGAETNIGSRQITFERLFIAGSTSGSLGVLAAIAGVLFTQLEQVIPKHVYDDAWTWVVEQSLIILGIFGVVGAILLWLLGIAGTMIKYGRFTISRQGDELFIQRGLLEKKQITVPLKRIQAIGFRQSPLRQPFGFGTLYAEIAGGSLEENSDFSAVLFPIMKKNEVHAFLEMLLPEMAMPAEILNPAPSRARKFYVFKALWPVSIPLIMVMIIVPSFVWIPGILGLAAACLGWMQYRDAGVMTEEEWIHVRSRRLGLTQVVIHHRRVQAFEKKQDFIQRHQALSTMEISIIGMAGTGTHYTIRDLETSCVDHSAEWFSYRRKIY